jgi:flagellar protein FliO/FliZ
MKSLTLTRGVALLGALTLSHASAALAATGGATTTGAAATGAATTGAATSGENTPLHLGGSVPGTHTVSGGGTSIVRTIVGLFIVIIVIYGLSWILRQAKRGGSARARGKALAQVATLPLGSGRSVQLVRAGREFLLVGVAEHGVTELRTYSEAEALAAGLDLPADEPPEAGVEDRPGGRLIDVLRRITVRS